MASASELRLMRHRGETLIPDSRCDVIVMAMLCGGRPALLSRTLASLRQCVQQDPVRIVGVAMLNSHDPESEEILIDSGFFGKIYLAKNGGKVVPIGPAVTGLMMRSAELAGQFDIQNVMHLEDDWQCCSMKWVQDAACYLNDPAVGQVRLRLASETVMTNNCISGRRIKWIPEHQHQISSNAHYTFNPNMIRAKDIPRFFGSDDAPIAGERGAQLGFESCGLSVVQVHPGAFMHIGSDASLRGKLGRGHNE